MNVAARFGVRSFAVDAVTALEQYLATLLGVAEVLGSQGHPAAGQELRRALDRAMRALQVLADELAAIEVIEHYVSAQQTTGRA